jgi:hypothetical protein
LSANVADRTGVAQFGRPGLPGLPQSSPLHIHERAISFETVRDHDREWLRTWLATGTGTGSD